jgi:Flp pilus assembly protein TadG
MRWNMSRPKQRAEGQSIVEFAIALPLLMLVIFSVIQVSLIFVAYYSETVMARENARWLAIRATNTSDATFAAEVQATMLPGLLGDTPVRNASLSGPSGVVYDIGQMRVTFTPCMSDATSPLVTTCSHANRKAGETLYVEMRYNVPPFLVAKTSPSLRIGSLTVKLPTELPPYRVSVMVE